MLYTIIGAILAGTVAFVVCKCADVDFKGSYGFSTGGLIVTAAIMAGASCGFGVGAMRLANGNYLPNC